MSTVSFELFLIGVITEMTNTIQVQRVFVLNSYTSQQSLKTELKNLAGPKKSFISFKTNAFALEDGFWSPRFFNNLSCSLKIVRPVLTLFRAYLSLPRRTST